MAAIHTFIIDMVSVRVGVKQFNMHIVFFTCLEDI